MQYSLFAWYSGISKAQMMHANFTRCEYLSYEKNKERKLIG